MYLGRKSDSTRRVCLLARNFDHVAPGRLDLACSAYVRPHVEPAVIVFDDLASETGGHQPIKCVLRLLHRTRLRTVQHYEPTTSHGGNDSHQHEQKQPQAESDD